MSSSSSSSYNEFYNKEAFICKECRFIIDEKDIAIWTQPSALNKVAVQFGHAIIEKPFNMCQSGKKKILENYSTGLLMKDISYQLLKNYNYLGRLNWFDLPLDYIDVLDSTEKTITENSLHTGINLHVENLGEVVINLPDATDFPPFGLDIFINISCVGTFVKIKGFSPQSSFSEVWLKSRNNTLLTCWSGNNNIGWLISNGNFLITAPV